MNRNREKFVGLIARAFPGLLLICALLFAPLAYGSMTIRTAIMLGFIIVASGVSAILSWIIFQQRISLPRSPVISISVLLSLGWWMAFNAHTSYAFPPSGLYSIHNSWSALPGSIDSSATVEEMWTISAILIAFCITTHLCREIHWQRTFFITSSVAGVIVAVLGIIQKWEWISPVIRPDQFTDSIFFFATFNNHASAGAFMNLTIPAGVVALWRTGSIRWKSLSQIMAVIFLIIWVLATFINVSKAAMLIAILMVIGWLVSRLAFTGPRKMLSASRTNGRIVTLCATGVLVAAAMGAMAHGPSIWNRWAELPATLTRNNGRVLMWRVCLGMIGDAGLFGMGPGTFKLAMPISPHMVKELYAHWIVRPYELGKPVAIWNHAHNDYLQAIIEWGWFGATAWGVLIFGGIGRAIHKMRLTTDPSAHALWAAIIVSLIGVMLHALVDWPLQVASIQLYVAVFLAIAWSKGDPQCASC